MDTNQFTISGLASIVTVNDKVEGSRQGLNLKNTNIHFQD
jgi:hypothetical protein